MLLLAFGVALPASAQGQAPPPDAPPDPPPIEHDDLERIRRVLDERMRQRELRGERDEIEEQLQRLLIERQIELGAQLGGDDLIEVQDGVVLQVKDGVVVRRPRAQVIGGPGLEARAYADPLADRPRDEVVAMLGDDDFAVREQAEAHLRMDNTLDRAALRPLIAGATSDEQRYRLIRVAEHHVMRDVRERLFGERAIDDELNGIRRRQGASIGFSYSPFLGDENPVTQTPGVMVTATMPGFPGHAYLRVGDRVIAINGQTARGIRHRELITSWISNRIGFHQPGDTIKLTVLREGQTLEVSIPCAQGRALSLMYVSNGLDPAFRQGEYTQMWLEARAELVEGVAPAKVLTPKAE